MKSVNPATQNSKQPPHELTDSESFMDLGISSSSNNATTTTTSDLRQPGVVTEPVKSSGEEVRSRKKKKKTTSTKKTPRVTNDSEQCSPVEESVHFRDNPHSQSLLRLSEDPCSWHWFHVLDAKSPHSGLSSGYFKSFGPWCCQLTSAGGSKKHDVTTVSSSASRDVSCSGLPGDRSLGGVEGVTKQGSCPRDKAPVPGGAKDGAGVSPKDKHAKTGDVFDRLSGQAPPFAFRHLGDVTGYMSEYRERCTVGRVCRKAKRHPVIGVDVPDPYYVCKKKKPCVCIACLPLPQSKMAAGSGEGASVHSGSSGSGKDNSTVARAVPNLAPVRHSRDQSEDKPSLLSPPHSGPTESTGGPVSDPTSLLLESSPTAPPPPQDPERQSGPSFGLLSRPDWPDMTLIGQSPGSGPIRSQTSVLVAYSLSNMGEQKEAGCDVGEEKQADKRHKRKTGHCKLRCTSRPPDSEGKDTSQVSALTSGPEVRQPITISVPLSVLTTTDPEAPSGGRKERFLPGILHNSSEKTARKKEATFQKDGFLNIALARQVYEGKVTLARHGEHRAGHSHRLSRATRSRSVDFLAGDRQSKEGNMASSKAGVLNVKILSVDDLPAALEAAEKGSGESSNSWRIPRHGPLPRILEPLVKADHVSPAAKPECWSQAETDLHHQKHNRGHVTDSKLGKEKPKTKPKEFTQENGHGLQSVSGNYHAQADSQTGRNTTTGSTPSQRSGGNEPKQEKELTTLPNKSSSTTNSDLIPDSAQSADKLGVRGRTMLDPESLVQWDRATNTETSVPDSTAKETAAAIKPPDCQISPLSCEPPQKPSQCFPAKQFKRLTTFFKPAAGSHAAHGGPAAEERKGRASRRQSNESRVPLSTIDPESLVVKGGTCVDAAPHQDRRGGERVGDEGQEGGEGRGLGTGDVLPVSYRLPKEAVTSLERETRVTTVR